MRVGFVGWRGMVGSVLMERMEQEGDFAGLESTFFSTSQVGEPAPREGTPPLVDAYDLERLGTLDVIVTCQGSGYTEKVWPALRDAGWQGYWIDAASWLRLREGSVIALDPVNGALVERAIERGARDLIGGNCTVSLLLMAIHGLIEQGWVEWVSVATYQAASGTGAAALRELVLQYCDLAESVTGLIDDPVRSALELERRVSTRLRAGRAPSSALKAPLAGSLLPWIDTGLASGQTREEYKSFAELNKILELETPIPVDATCVRVGALRCHSQAVTIKLVRELPLSQIEQVLASSNPWLRMVANTEEATLSELTPAAVTGSLEVSVGRLRKLQMGGDYLGLFTVGDQLLWGAAEPLRCVLAEVVQRKTVGV